MSGSDDNVGLGELSRQVRDVLVRFESLATRLETQFVRDQDFKWYQRLVDGAIKALQELTATLATSQSVTDLKDEVENKASKSYVDGLGKRIEALEDDKKWLVRLVLGFIVLGVLGAVFAVAQAGGA